MDDKKAFFSRMEEELKKWGIDLNQFQNQAGQASAEAKVELEKQLAQLKEKQKVAEAKLKDLSKSSDAAWQDMKAGAEKAFGELRTAFSSAKNKFKNS